MANYRLLFISALFLALAVFTGRHNNLVSGHDAQEFSSPIVEDDVGKSREASRTDDETVQREGEAINIDGLNPAQIKEIRDKSQKFEFQAEVDRMMKLIINSIYRNKEIFLRELISNASDALDKIRMLSLTDTHQMDSTHELSIRIKLDKENHMLHITDTGVGMTKDELINNLGTIAKSGTSEFLEKLTKSQESPDKQQASDLIGQFGVGFYSSFLVADLVTVKSKSNNDTDQWVWISDASSFSIAKDPQGNTLNRGTQISLLLKESAQDFLELNTLKDLVKKYSQFINFNIYLWNSKTESVEEPIEDEDKAEKPAKEEAKDADADVEVEDVKEDSKKPKTKKVEKTTWDWELINDVKPLWLRDPSEIKNEEYNEFYKSMTKDYSNPMAQTHFKAEGEVTFRSLLYIPATNAHGFQEYGKKHDIKLYVRRVFITDDFKDMMPNYLAFIRGLVDSDDLPLNVSREMLQQNKLLKVIKKKLVRKVLDMIKKLDKESFEKFWKEYSTNIKLGVIEDSSNRTRLSKLLRFMSSASGDKMTSLQEYVERMKDKQEAIYFIAGATLDEVKKSPFVEKLQKKGFEVLYLTEPVDEYCMQSLPDFDGKKLQNVAKEGLKLDGGEKAKEKHEFLEKEFKPLLDWLKENALKDMIEKAVISQRLTKSPCALVASSYGWSGNMERLMKSQAYAKANDMMQDYYANQKKTLEINPRHPVVKEMLERVKTDKDDAVALRSAKLLFDTSIIRGGYMLKDTEGFADRLESMLKTSLNINADEMQEEELEDLEVPAETPKSETTEEPAKTEDVEDKVGDEHIEL